MKIITFLFGTFSTLLTIAQSYSNIEAVEYDPTGNRFFVSNSNSIIQRNADESLEFFGNATASHGMEVMNGLLFAISSNTIYAYDLDNASVQMTLNIPGTSFLNGMASDGLNRIWVSDFGTGKLFEIDVTDLQSPQWSEIANALGSPNGIVYDGENNRLVFVHWGANAKIRGYDLATEEVSILYTTSLANIDGIDHDGDGNFYIASWSPNRISKFESTFSAAPETITVGLLSSPADICYAQETDTLAIPNSANETVLFVGFGETVNIESEYSEHGQFTLFPNPADQYSEVQFTLSNEENLELSLYSADGKLIQNIIQGTQPRGKHRVIVPTAELSSGIYIIKIIHSGLTQELKLLVR